MARTPNNGPSMSGTRPRFAFNANFAGGSGMSNDMLNSMFPDSLWKYGTLTEPEEEESYHVETVDLPKVRRRRRRKTALKKSKKRRHPTKAKEAKRPRRRKRRLVVKVKKAKQRKSAPRVPTVAEFIQQKKPSLLERKKRLEFAEKMKAKAMVKVRKTKLERSLSEIRATANSRPRVNNSKAALKMRSLRKEIRIWQRRIEIIRAEEAAYRRDLEKVTSANPPTKVPVKAVPPMYLYRRAFA